MVWGQSTNRARTGIKSTRGVVTGVRRYNEGGGGGLNGALGVITFGVIWRYLNIIGVSGVYVYIFNVKVSLLLYFL